MGATLQSNGFNSDHWLCIYPLNLRQIGERTLYETVVILGKLRTVRILILSYLPFHTKQQSPEKQSINDINDKDAPFFLFNVDMEMGDPLYCVVK